MLLSARGEMEALIDFSEDQHFDASPHTLCASVATQVRTLRHKMRIVRQNAVKGELLRSGISVALLGAPNAGKSSLLNRVVGREAAIVSREAGTTRDVVDVGVDLAGWFVRLGDMAGLRESSADTNGSNRHTEHENEPHPPAISDIELEGIRRARQRALESDLVILVLSLELPPTGPRIPTLTLPPEVVATAHHCLALHKPLLVALNKMDLLPAHLRPELLPDWIRQIEIALPGVSAGDVTPISCRGVDLGEEGDPGNLQRFLRSVVACFEGMTQAVTPDGEVLREASLWEEALGATERQRGLLDECVRFLDGFLGAVGGDGDADADGVGDADGEVDADVDIVVAAESLRAAAECLARITGRGEGGDVEEVLGVVFEKFCVGK